MHCHQTTGQNHYISVDKTPLKVTKSKHIGMM
jgi:hypothetical protein